MPTKMSIQDLFEHLRIQSKQAAVNTEQLSVIHCNVTVGIANEGFVGVVSLVQNHCIAIGNVNRFRGLVGILPTHPPPFGRKIILSKGRQCDNQSFSYKRSYNTLVSNQP